MRVTDRTRNILALRREHRRLTALGYRRHETDWEIHRGGAAIHDAVILDAKVSADGIHVYTLVGDPETKQPYRFDDESGSEAA